MRADKDPLLVSWRYGLGKVTAFTSDLSGRWGKEWVTWPALPQWQRFSTESGQVRTSLSEQK